MHFRDEFKKIIGLFLIWRFLLIVFSFIAVRFLPLRYYDRFLGGGFENYILSPWLFGWANFDGEHYLSIAIFGYKALEQAFFPLYPLFISLFAQPFSLDLFMSLFSATISGIVISNLSFALSLILLWDLVKIDFPRKIAWWTLILLLIFPTSFFFGAVYNESLFLLLVVVSFYSARKKYWWVAGVFGMTASFTRVFGITLLPTLLIEAYLQREKIRNFFPLLLIPLGLAIYMLYQWQTVGDALAFYNLQLIVGEQHQRGIVLLPQIFYRYIKMIGLAQTFDPIYQTIVLEMVNALLFIFLIIYGYFKKIRLSYLFYCLIGFLIPTIQGSFSSTPRYVLVLFPGFIAMSILVSSFPKIIKISLVIMLLVLSLVEVSLFIRGYWVA